MVDLSDEQGRPVAPAAPQEAGSAGHLTAGSANSPPSVRELPTVLWSLIRALAPAVRDRVVQVWAVDPKGGMELSASSPVQDQH
jgi:hypothetical protein